MNQKNYRIEPLGASNILAANDLTLKSGQRQHIAPASYGVATAMVDHSQIWSQVILEDDRVVGFISCSFDADHELPEFRSCILRVHVDAEFQRHGVGKFAVESAIMEGRRRGQSRLGVIWESGEDGPERFFLHMGFRVEGQTPYGEKIGFLQL